MNHLIKTPTQFGSAEVIARGTNEYTLFYTNLTNLAHLESWNKWESFPSVVRVGNFVYCLARLRHSSVYTYWTLIDIVPDPADPYRLGSNVAYPQITNEMSTSLDQIQLNPDDDESITNDQGTAGLELTTLKPYYTLPVTSSGYDSTSSIGGIFWSANYEFTKVYPSFQPNWSSARIIKSVNTHGIRIAGWGERVVCDGVLDKISLFAPFGTKKQFETLYGKQSDWCEPDGTQWMFEAPAGHANQSVRWADDDAFQAENADGRTYYYPFQFDEPLSNQYFINVRGDVNQDGVDDTPVQDVVKTIAGIAIADEITQRLDVTKCGYDFELNLGNLPVPDFVKSIGAKANEMKDTIGSAISKGSAGIQEIVEKAEGVKGALEDELSTVGEKLTENFSEALSKINPLDTEAIDSLKEKWSGVVDNIEDILENLDKVDICSLVDVVAKVDKNGVLIKKPEMEDTPIDPIELPKKTYVVPIDNGNLPRTYAQKKEGIAPNTIKLIEEQYENAWKKLYVVAMIGDYRSSVGEKKTEIRELGQQLKDDEEYQAIQGVVVMGLPAPSNSRLEEMEKKWAQDHYLLTYISLVLSRARQQIYQRFKDQKRRDITPDTDPRDIVKTNLWKDANQALLGTKMHAPGVIWAVYTQADLDQRNTIRDEILKAISEYILTEELIESLNLLSVAAPSEHVRNTEIDDLPQGSGVGDAGESSGEKSANEAGKTARDGSSGTVNYAYDKATTRNQTIQGKLFTLLENTAVEHDLTINIFSGGQPAKGRNRLGSHRHDNGYAADVHIYNKDGRRLTAERQKDIPELVKIVKTLRKNGAESIGAGPGYQNGNLHIDIASSGPANSPSAVWGADKTRKTAPQWLKDAF